MAESRFIRTVTFGGYDKGDVDSRLDYLYSQVYDLKNELRATKLINAKLKDGADADAAENSVLANERMKLTELQVKNETLSEKLKSTDDDNKKKEEELVVLRAQVKELSEQLNEANTKLSAASNGGDAAMFGVVFAEAQKSANMIIATAKQQAEDLEADSKKLAENMVADANNKASKIVYDAETRAAKIEADSKNDAANMSAASENMKATMLNDLNKIGLEVAKLKQVLVDFEESGLGKISESEKLLDDTKAELMAGGVPVFKEPQMVDPVLPDAPEYQKIDNSYVTGTDEKTKKNNEELDKLKAMADSIGGNGEKSKKSEDKDKAEDAGAIDLASLAKQAAAIDGKKSQSPKKDDKPAKDGGLGDLLKQAKSIK